MDRLLNVFKVPLYYEVLLDYFLMIDLLFIFFIPSFNSSLLILDIDFIDKSFSEDILLVVIDVST